MHSLMFRFKRAHWRGQALARKLAVNLGELTPSRYDLMRLVAGNGDGKQLQYMLWKALGVSRAAVSNMVRRMIELGLLDRARSLGDGRTFVIWLTEAGVAAFRVATSFIYGPIRPLFRCTGSRSARQIVSRSSRGSSSRLPRLGASGDEDRRDGAGSRSRGAPGVLVGVARSSADDVRREVRRASGSRTVSARRGRSVPASS